MKLSNIIFYNESWGIQNVIQKVHDTDKVPNVDEIVVLQIGDDYNFYKVLERVFDYADDIVHLRVEKSARCYNLTVM